MGNFTVNLLSVFFQAGCMVFNGNVKARLHFAEKKLAYFPSISANG
jgi:hypothetical protein